MSKSKSKIEVVLPLFRYGKPHRPGQVIELESKQADELVEAGYAKPFVAKKANANKEEAAEASDEK